MPGICETAGMLTHELFKKILKSSFFVEEQNPRQKDIER